MSTRVRSLASLACLSFVLGFAGHAWAADPVIPDPLAAPGDSLSLASKLYHSGAYVALAIVVAFFALSVAAKKLAWLTQGKRAAYTASALGALTLLAVPASQGTTPNATMIVTAVMTAVALILHPTPAPSPTPAA